ncbi:uncharacterized protein [Anser cygnoides]|uniref:uncharacterized protein isoform X3 n=1 Tax=Anser cygnoides TaxID=8845 RepID=UPI0034D202E1
MTSKPARPRGRGCSRTGAAGARSRGESRPRHLGAPGKIWLFLPCSRADSRRDCEFTEWDALGRAGTSPPERGEIPVSGEGISQACELLVAVGCRLPGLAV